jgi:hypothetical protein
MPDLTTIIALYGALLATILGILELYRFRVEQGAKKPKVKVTVTPSLISQGQEVSPALLTLEAANTGQVSVTFRSIPSLVLPNGKKLILVSADRDFDFPHTLTPGNSCSVWSEMNKIARELSKNGMSGQVGVVGEFTDSVGNYFRSKPFQFDIEGWAK